MSQSSDIPRPPRTDTARRLLVTGPPIPPALEPARPVRASDAEREDTVRLLHQALGEGRLDLQETETRVAAAYDAVHRGELPALLEDLPPHAAHPLTGATSAPDWRTLWTAVVWRARVTVWDGVGAASRSRPPGAGERRLAALLLTLAGLWLMVWAVIGAAL